MYWRAVSDSSHCAVSFQNAFSFPRKRDWCVCMPLPFCPKIGLGMNEAVRPKVRATYFTTNLNVVMLSAVFSASA